MASSSLTTLGGFAFKVKGVSTPGPATRKARALMAFLIMNRGADTARDRLLELFWPDADPAHARDSLITALSSIRGCLRALGAKADEFLFATKSIVRWTDDTLVDAERFAELATRERDTSASRAAVRLYRGDFLEGDYDDWAVAERERLSRLYVAVLARVVRSTKDPDAAHAVVARNPYDQEAYTVIVEAELAAGRRSSAAAWVERCRRAFGEISEKPSVAFEERFGRIVRFEPPPRNEVTPPFAGRERELLALAASFGSTRKFDGGLTIVHGVAGIGKSTLLGRAAQIANDNGLRVLTLKFGNETDGSFGPWKALFSTLCGGDFEAFARGHASNLTTAIAQKLSSQLTEPSVLIVDDVHTATSESLDIFIAVVRQMIAEHPVIAAVRAEGLSLLLHRLQDLPFEELEIGRLDRADLKWALAQALGSDQPETLNALYDRTGGHPMFFVGLLNSLVDTGALARAHHQWQLTKSIDANLELPDTVRRFIQTRLRARGERARAVACALALEPAADADDLAAALRFDQATTLDALDDLLSLGVIDQPSSGPQFAFTHDLVREVAAAELNAGRRASLHRGFAMRFEAHGKRHTSLRLAQHLRAAGEPMLAATAYLKSAEEALALSAPRDAIDRCNAGVLEAGSLKRTPESDTLLASLHRTAARAAIACGLANEAIKEGTPEPSVRALQRRSA